MVGTGARTTRLLAVVLACLVLTLSGCGGSNSGSSGGTTTESASPSPSAAASSGGSSEVCDALARFDNAFKAAVQAVASGDTNAVMGAASTLKEQAISLTQALQSSNVDFQPLATAVQDLVNTVTRLPHDATAQRAETALKPKVQAVGDAVQQLVASLKCPG